MNRLLVDIRLMLPDSDKIWKQTQELKTKNIKVDNLFNLKEQKVKYKWEYSADNEIFFYCDAG